MVRATWKPANAMTAANSNGIIAFREGDAAAVLALTVKDGLVTRVYDRRRSTQAGSGQARAGQATSRWESLSLLIEKGRMTSHPIGGRMVSNERPLPSGS